MIVDIRLSSGTCDGELARALVVDRNMLEALRSTGNQAFARRGPGDRGHA